MRGIFKNLKLIVAVILMIFVFPRYSFAQVKSLSLRVDGLACPFCAYGLEKKLTSLKGLNYFNINLKEGKAELEFKEDNNVNLAKIKIMVKDAGYTLRSMQITASGTIGKEKSNFLFNIKGNQNKLYIFDEHSRQEAKGGPPIIPLNEELKKKLEELLKSQAVIEISAAVHSHPDGSFGLSIEKYLTE